MADPLSLTASIIAVGRLTTTVSEIFLRLHEAGNETIALKNEVEDLQPLIKQFEELLKLEWDDRQRDQILDAQRQLDDVVMKHLRSIEDMLRKHLSNSSGSKFRHVSWVVLKKKANRAREDLRRAKRQLLDTFSLISVSDTHSIGFAIDRVVITSETVRGQVESLNRRVDEIHDVTQEVRRTLAEARQVPCAMAFAANGMEAEHLRQTHSNQSKLSDCHMQVESNLGSQQIVNIDATFASASARGYKEPKPSHNPLVHCILKGNKAKCSAWCSCRCHKQQQLLESPDFTHRLVGKLLVGFSVRSWMITACNEQGCKRDDTKILRLQYTFPYWFLNYAVSLLLSISSSHAPQLTIRVPRVRPSTDSIFHDISLGNLENVRADIVAGRASVDDIDDVGAHTLLHRALSARHWSLSRLFLFEGANVDAINSKQNTACDMFWTVALSKGVPDKEYEQLCIYFQNTAFIEEGQFSIIHRIVFGLRLLDLEEVLKDSTQLINQQDAYGKTPLSWAAARGDLKSVETLLTHGADPNIVDKAGWSPLHFTMTTLRTDISQRLLQAGADPNLRTRIWKDSPLHVTCHSPDFACHVPILLESGADPTLPSQMWDTPLQSAAMRGYTANVEAILGVTPRDRHARAINTAISYHATATLELLLGLGADCTGVDEHGMGVLHYTAMYCSIKELSIFIETAPLLDDDVPDKNGRTAHDIVLQRTPEQNWLDAWNQMLAVCNKQPLELVTTIESPRVLDNYEADRDSLSIYEDASEEWDEQYLQVRHKLMHSKYYLHRLC